LTQRDTLEDDLDRVLAGLVPDPVGEWEWDPPLGSAMPASPVGPAATSEPEDAEDPEEDPEEEQDPEDDA
jgi:hypothetical protein